MGLAFSRRNAYERESGRRGVLLGASKIELVSRSHRKAQIDMNRIGKLGRVANRVRIQYASNIFAYKGVNPCDILTPGTADTLALLGNVGNFETSAAERNTREFIEWCAAHWTNVLWVPGPMEFGSVQPKFWWQLQDRMFAVARAANETSSSAGNPVQVLSYSEYTRLKQMRVVAIPGWSFVLNSDTKGHNTIWFSDMKQKERIATPMSPEFLKEFYTDQMEILKAELDVDNDMPTILLSHGLPSMHLIPNANTDGLQKAFRASTPMGLYNLNHVGVDRLNNVKAILCGAIGSCTSGTWGQRFMGSNAYKMSPDSAGPNKNYMPDRFYEYCQPPPEPTPSSWSAKPFGSTPSSRPALPLPSLVPS